MSIGCSASANAEAMFMEALGGQVSRDEGWVIYLTTQSDEPPAGVFKERLDYWRDVRDGKIEDRKTLGVLYEFPEAMREAGVHDPANFYITNPNIGRSVSKPNGWKTSSKRTSRRQTARFQQFLAKHLNVEIGLNLRTDRWAGADFWERRSARLDAGRAAARCEVAVVGIDGGGLDDLLGLAVGARARKPAAGCIVDACLGAQDRARAAQGNRAALLDFASRMAT
jgi:phage terminase large subunit-like protein